MVVAVGNCGRDAASSAGSYACVGGVGAVLPVDLHIYGRPPSRAVLLKVCFGILACVDSEMILGVE